MKHDQNKAPTPPGANAVPTDTSNISIIVQGPCDPATPNCLSSLRRCFPGAEIILSTWKGSSVSGLDADRIVLSEDPGAVCADEVSGVLNNVNRQLVSTQNALPYATKPFVLKTRTDLIFFSSDFLLYFKKFDTVPSPWFKGRLLICNYFTRNPRIFHTCFHPSDWIMFGCAEDVKKYYAGIPLMDHEDATWFYTHPKSSVFYTNYLCRYVPEQYIFLSFLKQKMPVSYDCYYSHNAAQIQQTERLFAECFVVLDYQKQLHIGFTKYNPNRYRDAYSLLTHWQWKILYFHYCGKNRPWLWNGYLFKTSCFRFLTKARIKLIRLLELLGLKERVKEFVSHSAKKRGNL